MVCQLDELSGANRPLVLAAGYFDGVHRGHQAVISEAVRLARASGGEAWALTLDPHPLKILQPDAAPPLLTSTPHKARLMESFGAEGCVVLPFTRELAAVEPEAFVGRLVRALPTLDHIVIGRNWTFGHNGRGTADTLIALSKTLGFGVAVVDPVLWRGKPISSTRVREAVARGRLADGEAMLGRPFSVLGTVEPGRQFGTKLGFPTANLDPHNEVRPPSGIYAAWADLEGRRYPAAVFLADASHAQSGPSGCLLEAHLIGFQGADLYGRDIEIFFVKRMRGVERFETADLLRRRIARDVAEIGDLLRQASPS